MSSVASWTQTFSGKKFVPLEPIVDMVCIEDIAHGLSNVCRFSGQTQRFYSVAEHAWRASFAITRLPGIDDFVGAEQKMMCLIALMHDASESYIVDVPTPIKPHLKGYYEIEEKVMRVIAEKFGLDFALFSHPLIKKVDLTMLATEKRDLMGPPPAAWVDLPLPDSEIIEAMLPKKIEQLFLDRFEQLGGRHDAASLSNL